MTTARAHHPGYVTHLLNAEVQRFMADQDQRQFLVYPSHKAMHPNVVQPNDGGSAVVEGRPEGQVPAPRHRGRYARRHFQGRPGDRVPSTNNAVLMCAINGLPPIRALDATLERLQGG